MIPFLILFPLAVALSAYTYAVILTEGPMILNPLHRFLERNLYWHPVKGQMPYGWLFKPLIGCERCVAGWWGLLSFLYYSFVAKTVPYDPVCHLFVVLASIYCTRLFSKLYEKLL